MKFLGIFLLVAVVSAQELQPRQFLAQLVRQQGTGEEAIRQLLALGVMIDHRHIVTVANVLNNVPPAQLRAYLQTDRLMNSTDIREVEQVFIHDQFNISSPYENNVAVIKLTAPNDNNVQIYPRILGSLTPNRCNVFSFPGLSDQLLTTSVFVRSADCLDSMPFCGNVTFPDSVASCGGVIGSPVICDDQSRVSGIANTEMDCTPLTFPLTGRMTFLGFQDYSDWILRVSGANFGAKISLILLVFNVAVLNFFMKFFK